MGEKHESRLKSAGQLTERTPKHIAISVRGCQTFAEKHNLPLLDVYRREFTIIQDLVPLLVEKNVPVFSFYVLPSRYTYDEQETIIDALVEFFTSLASWDVLHKNQIKVMVLGSWYNLPGRLIDPIKAVLSATKDYDKFFFNMGINYDGQDEIVQAARLLAKQAQLGKITPESIDRNTLKEALYTSYFVPPDIIIKTGKSRRLRGFLLWDSVYSKIYFSKKLWPEFSREDLLAIMKQWQKEI